MRFVYKIKREWPPLAWLARCRQGDTIELFHGRQVETGADWYHEAVWDGEPSEGDFDRTDLVFGSGGRLRDGSVVFVSSGSTLDRLHSLAKDKCLWVSNSLACLCSAVDAKVDTRYTKYKRDLHSIRKGLDDYERKLETSAGPIRLTYFYNLRWDGVRLHEVEKPNPNRDFSSFAHYREFLQTSLRHLAANMSSGQRQQHYSMLGTLTTGYDSPAVTALARPEGLTEVLCSDERPAAQDPDDSSAISDQRQAIAETLGVKMIHLSRDAWQEASLGEVPFLVGDTKGMDIWLRSRESQLQRKVLLTGNHGDDIWSKAPKNLGDRLQRGPGLSGLSLTEYRLWAGFIHCPVPYFGARQAPDINAITLSDEMAPWDIGGSYNRPIPRRITEEAGISRAAFGIRKRGTSVWLAEQETFRSSPSASDYLAWLSSHRGSWLRAGRLPPSVTRRLARPAQAAAGLLAKVLRTFGVTPMRSRLARDAEYFSTHEAAFRYMFAWALERATSRYGHRPIES